MPRICLLALIGLPAAGKTTLSHQLLANAKQYYHGWSMLHLCYDDYITKSAYKQQRVEILQLLSQHIDNIQAKKYEKLPSMAQLLDKNKFLIICDDNHYYHSMRYKLQQLCRAKNCIYAQIFLCKTLVECLAANAARGGSIPSTVIEEMHARLEAPSASNAWECHSLTLEQIDVPTVAEFLLYLQQCPVMTETSKSIPKQTQLQSQTHQLDLLLRSSIQSLMQQNQSDEQISKAAKSRILNAKRKQILALFRQQNSNHNNVNLNDNDSATVQLDYYVNLLNLV